jgi:hypothetical protein
MSIKWKPGKYAGRVPTLITPSIRQFALEWAGKEDLQFVPFRAMLDLGPLHCYQTCDMVQDAMGFPPVLGYSFWNTNDLFLSAEHHCVCREPNGDLVDPTSDMTGCQHVLFLVTDMPPSLDEEHLEAIYERGESCGYKVLVDHHLIHEAVETLSVAGKQLHKVMQAGVTRDHLKWYDRQMDIVDGLIDRFYAEQAWKQEKEKTHWRRIKRKRERKRRAKSK